MAAEVKLFKTWSSPFGLRVVWALKLKGIEYVLIDEDLQNKSPQLLQHNPVYKKVPVLLHNGKSVVESLVILEYIDETWEENPLLPADPYERARARFWAKFGDDKVFTSVWLAHKKKGEQQDAAAEAVENLKFLEEQLQGKKFFGGGGIGLVDLAFGWLANLVTILEEVTSQKVTDDMKFPLLLRWMQEFSDRPEIKENWPARDKLIVRLQAMLGSS